MSETTNLKLFKHDEPLSTNQNQFDIDKALHQNWDKIDEYVGANNQNIQTLQNQNTDLQQQNVNLQEENNLLKSQIPNGQAVGENITLTDSSNLPYEKFYIGGKSVQETRSGKNELILPEKENSNFRGGKISINNGVITLNGTTTEQGVFIVNTFQVKETGNYCFSRELSQTATSIWVLLDESTDNSTWTNIVDWNFSELVKSSVLSLSKDKYYRIRLSTNANLTFSSLTIKLQLELDNAKTDWEQGGASPSPEFPSEIKSVGDNGTVEIKQRGKNIFDKNKSIIKTGVERIILPTGIRAKMTLAGTYQYLGIELGGSELLGKEITIGATITPSANNEGLINIRYGNSNGEVASSGILLEGVGTKSVTGKIANAFPDNCDRVYALLYGNKAGTGNVNDYVDYTNVMVVIGDTLGDYEQYKGNNYVLQISEPLRSLPNGVRDTIEEDGIHRRIGSIVLDGSENWKILNTGTSNYYYYLSIGTGTMVAGSFVCTHYIKTSIDNNNTSEGMGTTSGQIRIRYGTELSIEEFKKWLSENPITVQYELAEEVIEPYTDNQLQNATSYKNITHIFSRDEVSPVFNVTYKKDLETLFNNLNSALVQGGV